MQLRQEPPFRPSIDESKFDEVIIGLILKCWAENPADRPDFPTIRKTIRTVNRANESSNIVDNLLKSSFFLILVSIVFLFKFSILFSILSVSICTALRLLNVLCVILYDCSCFTFLSSSSFGAVSLHIYM